MNRPRVRCGAPGCGPPTALTDRTSIYDHLTVWNISLSLRVLDGNFAFFRKYQRIMSNDCASGR